MEVRKIAVMEVKSHKILNGEGEGNMMIRTEESHLASGRCSYFWMLTFQRAANF